MVGTIEMVEMIETVEMIVMSRSIQTDTPQPRPRTRARSPCPPSSRRKVSSAVPAAVWGEWGSRARCLPSHTPLVVVVNDGIEAHSPLQIHRLPNRQRALTLFG